ncbi:MAG: GDP-L-fucose synthase [Proteobacteria bacterium]|nr:GDP-L-fucose synthase [Pseudomonadota bacterium]
MKRESSIFVAGHRGMVGSALVRALHAGGFENLILRDRSELDLTRQADVERFFATARPEYVLLAAAKVGGILANDSLPVQFIYDNLAIQTNVIDAAHRNGTRKLLFLGSSCVYPRLAPQPITEASLLTGPLEPTNEWYALAKIAGIKMCEAYRRQYGFNAISVMPTNLYGPEDNFDLTSSHVLPALLRKFHEAVERGSPTVEVWGSGAPRREFLHVDDLAAACLFLMERLDEAGWINVGAGTELTIAELARTLARVTGFRGEIRFDTSKPDGTPRKLLDSSRMRALGWAPSISLEDGVRSTYDWYRSRRRAGA